MGTLGIIRRLVVGVEAEERDGSQKNGAEQDLGYVIVKDLVVGIREVILPGFGN
jgi:hypothetical protein